LATRSRTRASFDGDVVDTTGTLAPLAEAVEPMLGGAKADRHLYELASRNTKAMFVVRARVQGGFVLFRDASRVR